MWRDFNETTTAVDLQRASRAGFNFARTWVNYVVWEAEGSRLTAKLQYFVTIANSLGIQVMIAPFNSYRSCVTEDGGTPTYNFTAACFFSSPAEHQVHDPGWWKNSGEPYIDALTQALPSDTPGLLLWDVVNEPQESWAPFVLHFLQYFKKKTTTPRTFGASYAQAQLWAVNGTSLGSAVDVSSFHSCESSRVGLVDLFQAISFISSLVLQIIRHGRAGSPHTTRQHQLHEKTENLSSLLRSGALLVHRAMIRELNLQLLTAWDGRFGN